VLRNCIRSVREDLKDAAFEWELIVTDSATIEKTEDMMQSEFQEVVFIPAKENIGFGKSINIALKRAKGEYLFIINADILMDEKGAIENMLAYISKHPEIGMLGPKLWNINDTWQQSCFRFYTPMTVFYRRTPLGRTGIGRRDLDDFLMKDVFSKGDLTEPTPVDWLMGSAMMVRKSDLEKVGGFDERYFMYFEDVDWARRFWESGLKVVYFPKVTMYHHHFQSSKKSSLWQSAFNKYARIHILSAIKYFRKFGMKKVRYGV
jgi:N-acetylglucosaminyl-diphospho-decaprenol L-rhamnosyltransferase